MVAGGKQDDQRADEQQRKGGDEAGSDVAPPPTLEHVADDHQRNAERYRDGRQPETPVTRLHSASPSALVGFFLDQLRAERQVDLALDAGAPVVVLVDRTRK